MKVKLYLVINDTTGKFLKVYQKKSYADKYKEDMESQKYWSNEIYKVIEIEPEYDFSGYELWRKQ